MAKMELAEKEKNDVIGSTVASDRDPRAAFPKTKEPNDSKRPVPVDHKMHSKYEDLAVLVKKAVDRQNIEQQADEDQTDSKKNLFETVWFAIAGGPGSGKSTLAKRVSEICQQRFGIPSIVVPMDGYLYSRADLSNKLELDPRGCLEYLRRRGSPHTVNAEKLYQDLLFASGKQPSPQNSFNNVFGGDGNLNSDKNSVPLKPSSFAFPDYRRSAPSDPVANQIKFDPSLHKVVFVEGEYLLLGKEGMVPGYVTETEARRWKPLLNVFDVTWFVTCQQQNVQQQHQDEDDKHHSTAAAAAAAAAAQQQEWHDYDFTEQRKRRTLYHLEEAEDDEETTKALFPSFSSKDEVLSKEDVASKRIDSNDALNMLIAETSKHHASLIIQSI